MQSERLLLLASATFLAVCLVSWELWSHSQRTSGYVWERIWDTGVEKKRLDHEEVLSGVAVDAAVGSKMVKLQGSSQLIAVHDDHQKGFLFTCGVNEERLGRKGPPDTLQRAQEGLNVLSVSGSRHTVISTAEGAVYTCGKNNSNGGGGHGSIPIPESGQLGRIGSGECGQVMWGIEDQTIVSVTAGRYHSVALAQSGRVYSWGLNDHGQLGRTGKEDTPRGQITCRSGHSCRDGVPGIVSGLLNSTKIVKVSAGRYWTLAISEAGRLYTWGFDGCGSSGKLPETNKLREPRLVTGALLNEKVVDVDSGYTFWIAITQNGAVFTCNTGDDGYAATLETIRIGNDQGELGREGNSFLPSQVEGDLKNKTVVSVAAGRAHALAATAEGQLFSWGSGGSVIGRDGDSQSPRRVAIDDQIVFVAAGEYFSLAASKNHVYGFGRNGYGALSIPEKEVLRPQEVEGTFSTSGLEILDLQAGYQHSLVLASIKDKVEEAIEPETKQDKPVVPSVGLTAQESLMSGLDLSPLYQTFPGFIFKEKGSDAVRLNPFSYLERQVNHRAETVEEVMNGFSISAQHSEIASGSADVFQMLPSTYDPDFKNPCWFKNQTIKCLPYFNILGVSKCGTTDLYARIHRHSQIQNSRNKGPHFWDECSWPPHGICTVPPDGGFGGYIELFSDAGAHFQSDKEGIVGEASSNTFTGVLKYYRGTGKKLNVTLADLLHEAQPYLRLIIIFRNPADRYFSAYHYYRDREKEGSATAEAFHNTTLGEIQTFLNCVTAKSRSQCSQEYIPQQLVKGMYNEFTEYWLRAFPRHQILFLRMEDYKMSLRAHMKAIFKFLDVREVTVFEMDKIEEIPTANHQESHEPMMPKTRQLLEQFYAPFNSKLAEQLQDARFLWQDV